MPKVKSLTRDLNRMDLLDADNRVIKSEIKSDDPKDQVFELALLAARTPPRINPLRKLRRWLRGTFNFCNYFFDQNLMSDENGEELGLRRMIAVEFIDALNTVIMHCSHKIAEAKREIERIDRKTAGRNAVKQTFPDVKFTDGQTLHQLEGHDKNNVSMLSMMSFTEIAK